MLINISGQKFEVTPAIKEYAEEKIQKLNKHFKNITQVHLVLSVEKGIHHKIKAELHLAGGTIEASADTNDMYASIDAIKDKLDIQIC